jgi:hypothetical protein
MLSDGCEEVCSGAVVGEEPVILEAGSHREVKTSLNETPLDARLGCPTDSEVRIRTVETAGTLIQASLSLSIASLLDKQYRRQAQTAKGKSGLLNMG